MESTSNSHALRVRLEGAAEALEADRSLLLRAAATLDRADWKRSLRAEPGLFERVARALPRIDEGAAKVKHLQSLEEDPFLSELLRSLEGARATLTRSVERRNRARVPLSVGLAQLQERVLTELPNGPLEGEARLAEGGVARGYGGAFALLLLLANALAVATAPTAVGPVLGVLSLLFLALVLRSGSYVLTNKRLVWRPYFGAAREVALQSLPAGALTAKAMSSIRVGALEPFTMPAVEQHRRLLALAHAERFLTTRHAALPATPTTAAVFPGRGGTRVQLEAQNRIWQAPASNGVVVMTDDWAAFFPQSRSAAVVGALLALGADAAEVDLEAVLGALRALPAQQFKTLVQGVARTEGMLLERPASRLTSAGPVWQRLAVGDGQLGFEAKIDWRYLESVEAIVASWRAG